MAPLTVVFPDAIVEGAIDRKALKGIIVADPAALSRIEEVVHPLVAADRRDFLDAHRDSALVVLDIPLLFETGGAAGMDGVLVVSAPPEEQRRRVLERGEMSPEMFGSILARQTPDTEKRQRADYVIETTSLEQTRKDVRELIERLSGGQDA